jgi:hypothetical protein
MHYRIIEVNAIEQWGVAIYQRLTITSILMMKLNTKENLNDGTVALSFDRHEIGHKNSDTKLKY